MTTTPATSSLSGRIGRLLAAWGRAITAALATEHGWCVGHVLWDPYTGYLGVPDPQYGPDGRPVR